MHPRLKQSDRRLQTDGPLPADLHCSHCNHRLARGKHFYFSTDVGTRVPEGGIHTAVWLNVPIEDLPFEDRPINDPDDSEPLFTVKAEYFLLSSKGLAQHVYCQCGKFVGTVTWDSADGLLPPVSGCPSVIL